MDALRIYLSAQLLLIVLLVALLWSLYARLHKQLFYWWWAWAWTSFAGFLALGFVALKLAPGWTLLKGSFILAAMVCGFIQVPLLVFGAWTLLPPKPPPRYSLRVGIGLAVGAGVLTFALPFIWRGPPLASFFLHAAPRTLALATALYFCAWIFLARWWRLRCWGAGITGWCCLLYGVDETLDTLVRSNRLIFDLGIAVSQLFGLPLVLDSPLLFFDLLFGSGICLGMVLVLVDEHRSTDNALRDSNNRIQVIAAANAALEAEIRERQRVEAELRESEDRYRDLVEQSQDLLCVHDLGGRLLSVNAAPARILGYEVSELLGMPMHDVLAPEFRDQFEAYLARIQKDGVADGLMAVMTRTGQRRIWEYRNTLRTEGVPFPVVRGMAHDVTERKQAEKALKKSEEKFFKAFRQSPMSLTITSAKDHRYIDVNESFERDTGWRRDEIIGRTVFDVGRYVDRTDRMELVNRVLTEGRSSNRERRVRIKDGSIRVILSASELIELEGEPCVLSVFTDVTEHKKMQEALRESEDNLRLLLDSTAEAIFGIDLEGRCTFCNPAGLRALGYQRVDELLGKDMHNLIHHTRADGTPLPVEECRIRSALRAGEGVHIEEELLWRANGTSFAAEFWSHPQRRGEAVVGAVITFIDIIERKQAEAALRRSEEQLRHAQKMDALGRLAGGVAHDFNNLLCGITLHLDLALERVKPRDRALLQDLNRALDAARSAASVVGQLLTISRREVVQRQIVSLNDIVIRASDLLGRLLSENIYLSVRLGKGGDAKADPLQMQQVVMNLVLNARDAMPEGGRIVISTGNVDLEATPVGEYFTSLPKPGPYVVLEVSDTGYGMSGETLSHLFEPFFTTKELGRGTGLGLAVAYGIVTQSDGYISVQTVLGHGTTFKVYLPRVVDSLIEESPPRLKSVQQSPSLSKPPTILLVDDTEVVRDAVSKDLRQRGYFVLTASRAIEALRISEEYKRAIDLLLTDVALPGMNGRELARRFLEKRPSSKVLYISGYDQDTVAAEAAELGSGTLLYKPFSSRELLDAVTKVLGEQVASPGQSS